MILKSAICLLLLSEIFETVSEDPLLIVHQDVPDETRLPNAHSASVVMGCIFLCVIAYCLYRFCKYKCGNQNRALAAASENQKGLPDGDGFKGLEDYIQEREAYLAIYGTKRNSVNVVANQQK